MLTWTVIGIVAAIGLVVGFVAGVNLVLFVEFD